MKILGGRAQRARVEAILSRMSEESKRWKRIRSVESGAKKTFAKRYGDALGKVIEMMKKAPADLHTYPWMTYGTEELSIGRWATDEQGKAKFEGEGFPSHDALLRHLSLLRSFCKYWEKIELSQKNQKPPADDRRIAARAARILCEEHSIKSTDYINGKFCRLAAALYGKPSANLRPHCQSVLKEASRA
jgi:hypothetical protein